MKIAICFHGHLRTAEYAAENLLHFIGDLLPNCDFFMHTWAKNEYKHRKKNSYGIIKIAEELNCDVSQLTEEHYAPFIPAPTLELLEKVKKIYNNQFIKIEVEDNENFKKYYNPKLSRNHSWLQSHEMKKKHEKENNFKYDFVIKLRTDAIFDPNVVLKNLIDEFTIKQNTSSKPFFFRSDDVIIMSTSEIMDRFFETDTYMRNLYIIDGVESVRVLVCQHTFYRPEAIPQSSLDFEARFNEDWKWYNPSEMYLKSPFLKSP
jgi:hypothetical protein